MKTETVRAEPDWRVAGAGPGLERRQVEITGLTDRKMTINAMNSGAGVWLADHEDATSPTWHNVIDGQINRADAIRRQIDYLSPEGKRYELGEVTPTIALRPRGWHLVEKHLRDMAAPAPAPAPAPAHQRPRRWWISACMCSTTPMS